MTLRHLQKYPTQSKWSAKLARTLLTILMPSHTSLSTSTSQNRGSSYTILMSKSTKPNLSSLDAQGHGYTIQIQELKLLSYTI